MRLAYARVNQRDRVSLRVIDRFAESRNRADRVSVRADENIALLKPGFFGDIDSRSEADHLNARLRSPTGAAGSLFFVIGRSDGKMHPLAIAAHPHVHRLANAPHLAKRNVLPGGVRDIIDLNHLVAFMDSRL